MDDQNIATAQPTDTTKQEINDAILNEDIIKILKLDHLPEEQQENLRQKMIDTIEQRVMARLMDSLNAEDQQKLNELLNQENTQETQQFIESKMNIKEVAAQETLLYKMEMIDNAQKIDTMIQNPTADNSQSTTDQTL